MVVGDPKVDAGGVGGTSEIDKIEMKYALRYSFTAIS